MITLENLMSIEKSDLQEASKALNKEEVYFKRPVRWYIGQEVKKANGSSFTDAK